MNRVPRKPKKKKVAPGQGKTTFRNKCTSHDIAKVVCELQANDLALKDASGATQLDTLLKALRYLGSRGLSTYEGVAAGYLRIATRIKELKSTWEIITLRESYVGPDGLYHQGVARYVFIGRRHDVIDPQGCLDLRAS